jgi:hypothetical protein
MAEIYGWFTMNGRHIPIMKGQSKAEAAEKYLSNKHVKTASKSKVVDKKATKVSNKGDKSSSSKTNKDIKEKEDFVKNTMSNNAKPFEKESSINIDEVQKRGGVSKNEAKLAVDYANKVFDKAKAEEPQITSDVIASAKNANGTMYGLDFRMKQPTSMAGKIASDYKQDNISLEKASSGIKDAIRYTAILDDNNFTSGYNSMKKSLENKGYTELRCKNFYSMYKEGSSQQKAIQCVYMNNKGQTFELQFHTTKSQGVKELLHPMYEEYRRSSTSNERRLELDNAMKALSGNVPDPSGVYNIISYS